MGIDRREQSTGNSTRGKTGLRYSHYLGMEKNVYERISIGAEARVFYIAGYYNYIKDSTGSSVFERSRGQLDFEIFDSFKLYFKVAF